MVLEQRTPYRQIMLARPIVPLSNKEIGYLPGDSQSNGLSHLIEKMQGQPLYAHVNLEKGERSELAMLASELL